MSTLADLTARELLAGYAERSFTPDDALDACLARIDATRQKINAFIHVDPAAARIAARASTERWSRGAPRGALDGVPVSVKDNLHVAAMPTTWGSRLLDGYVPAHDEIPVSKLRAAGAVIVGKTNTPEFAVQGYTDNLVAGKTRNPWNPALSPGGSSGGAAASVAARCTPLALTTDGGGSTRRPASHCGVVGFKPSRGRIERGGGLPEVFLDFETIGGIGRSVDDVRLLMTAAGAPGTIGAGSLSLGADAPGIGTGAPPLDALAAAAIADARPLRILYVARFGDNPVDPRIAANGFDTAERFRSLGHSVVAFDDARGFDLADDINRMWSRLSGAGLGWLFGDQDRWRAAFGDGRPSDLDRCTPATQAIVRDGLAFSAGALFELLASVRTLERRLDTEVFAPGLFDFMMTPCTAALPWPVDETHPATIAGVTVGPRGHAVFTALANAAGLPALALPTGLIDNLPTGIQLIGRRDADADVLALGTAYEALYPFDKRPAL